MQTRLAALVARNPESLHPTVLILVDSNTGRTRRVEVLASELVLSTGTPPRVTVSVKLPPSAKPDDVDALRQKLRQALIGQLTAAGLASSYGSVRIEVGG